MRWRQVGSGQFTRALDRQLLLGAGAYGVSARYGGRFSSASVKAAIVSAARARR
jgi:uncharacterized protein with beta-barrel porin domain